MAYLVTLFALIIGVSSSAASGDGFRMSTRGRGYNDCSNSVGDSS